MRTAETQALPILMGGFLRSANRVARSLTLNTLRIALPDMPSLSSLRLKDVQSHKDSVLPFHPGLNVVVGTSNSGKSTIIRGLLFLFTGEWSKSYVRHGCKDSEIEGQLEDGTIIERIKGSVNKVAKVDSNGVRTDFSGFGTTLPVEISSAFGILPFRIDKDKALQANVCMQHDSLFLLKETGSYCAKILGRLSGLHLVDIALRNLNADIKNNQNRIALEEQRIESANKALEKYSVIDKQVETLKLLKEELSKQQRLREESDRISTALREVESYNADVKTLDTRRAKYAAINIESIRSEFSAKLIEVGHCPTCSTELTPELAGRCLGNS